MRPAKTQISLDIRPVWSESSLSPWGKLESLATHWVHSEDSDQTGRMPKLIWVFAGCTCHFVGFVTTQLISYHLSSLWLHVVVTKKSNDTPSRQRNFIACCFDVMLQYFFPFTVWCNEWSQKWINTMQQYKLTVSFLIKVDFWGQALAKYKLSKISEFLIRLSGFH